MEAKRRRVSARDLWCRKGEAVGATEKGMHRRQSRVLQAIASIPVLEVKVEQLKAEAEQLREQLKVTNSKLLAEIDAKREVLDGA